MLNRGCGEWIIQGFLIIVSDKAEHLIIIITSLIFVHRFLHKFVDHLRFYHVSYLTVVFEQACKVALLGLGVNLQ